MSTSTVQPDASGPSATSGPFVPADRGAPANRPLHLPPPGWRREPVVQDALGELARRRRKDLAQARRVIAEHGLTIEVARLRERLARAPGSDVQRLLLATPGVPERLFLEAIREQLDDEVRAERVERNTVRDDSVEELGRLLATALERLGDVLQTQAGRGTEIEAPKQEAASERGAGAPKQVDVSDAPSGDGKQGARR